MSNVDGSGAVPLSLLVQVISLCKDYGYVSLLVEASVLLSEPYRSKDTMRM